MKTIIIGAGVAGQTVAEQLRNKDASMDITIITEEGFPYYSRVNLPYFLAGEKTLEELIVRKLPWYQEKKIHLMLNTRVIKIDPAKKAVSIDTQKDTLIYNKLVLATGSSARKLPYNKPNIEGMFTLRSLANAQNIVEYVDKNKAKEVVVIGGGLLGIELGYHLRQRGLNVTICEIFPYLLPRQLDKEISLILQKYLEFKGMHIICGEEVNTILGETKVSGISFKSGKSIEADVIFQQMGVVANLNLAKDAGLKTEKGIIVNEFMQTNDPNIYAAGDCIQFNNQLWGIIPPSLEQARLAAGHILGLPVKPYTGTVWLTRLKIAGIKLACYGNPPIEGSKTQNVIQAGEPEYYSCRKLVIEGDILKGAILMGPADDMFFQKKIGQQVKVDELQEKLKETSKDETTD